METCDFGDRGCLSRVWVRPGCGTWNRREWRKSPEVRDWTLVYMGIGNICRPPISAEKKHCAGVVSILIH